MITEVLTRYSRIFQCIFAVFSVLMVLCLAEPQAFAEASEIKESEPWVWEIAIAEIYMQSQENIRYLNASSTQDVAVFPAVGKLIDIERSVATNWTCRGAFLFPIRQELVYSKRSDRESTHFSFARALGASANYQATAFRLGMRGLVEVSPGLGAVFPFVYFGKDRFAIPEIHVKTRVSSPSGAGLVLEVGYAGVVSAGTFFGRVGVSSRL